MLQTAFGQMLFGYKQIRYYSDDKQWKIHEWRAVRNNNYEADRYIPFGLITGGYSVAPEGSVGKMRSL